MSSLHIEPLLHPIAVLNRDLHGFWDHEFNGWSKSLHKFNGSCYCI